jgi:hypothetical protein
MSRDDRHRMGVVVLSLLISAGTLLFVARAFGGGPTTPSGGAKTDSSVLYQADGLVLEDGSHGPKLCLGVIADSLPPQCGGIPITNWDWGAAQGEQTSQETTWGSYHVVGTYDGSRFTLTEEPSPAHDQTGTDLAIDTPCPPPDGGWPAPDPPVSQEDLGPINSFVSDQPDFAGDWIDYQGQPDANGDHGSDRTFVFNAAFTGDLAKHQQEIEQRWSGPVCVVQMPRTYKELRSIQAQLSGVQGLDVLDSDVDIVRNRVDVDVVFMDAGLRQDLDSRFGPGAVDATPALTPVG